MRTHRLIQNFSGRRALIWALAGRTTEALTPSLVKLGLTVETVEINSCSKPLIDETLNSDAAVLFIDGDLALPACWQDIGEQRFTRAPLPVVGLVGIEAPSRLKALMQLEASAFLTKPVYGGAVYSALYLAVNQFNQREMLRDALDDLFDKRRKRAFVIKAVLEIMRSGHMNEDDAYARLRKESMRQRMSIEDYCVGMATVKNAHHKRDDQEWEQQAREGLINSAS